MLLIPLAETIKELDNFILNGVDLVDHTIIFLWRTINHITILLYKRDFHDSFQSEPLQSLFPFTIYPNEVAGHSYKCPRPMFPAVL